MTERLYIADLNGKTEFEVKAHLSEEYAGNESGFNYGNPSAHDKAELLEKLNGYDVLIAYEHVGSYGCDSSSWFLLRDKNNSNLYELNGSHCSCYGFEGQFDLVEAPIEYLKSDKFYFSTGGYDHDDKVHRAQVAAYLVNL